MTCSCHRFCPNCGTDIRVDEPVTIGEFHMMGDGYPLMYQGERIHLTPNEKSIVWSLLKDYPLTVKTDAVLIRCGSDGDNNLLRVLIRRIRNKLIAAGAGDHIETVWGSGYRWRMP